MVVVLILICGGVCISASWRTYSTTSTEILQHIHFINADSGYVSGNRTLLQTTNGGRSWRETQMDRYISSMHFLALDTGFVCSKQVMHTTDGGKSWDTLYRGVNGDWMYSVISRVEFSDKFNGIAVGDSRLYYTTDRGYTWTKGKVDLLPPNRLFGISMPTPNIAFVCSWGEGIASTLSMLHKSTDGGRTWQLTYPWITEQATLNNASPNVFQFVDQYNGWFAQSTGYSYNPNLVQGLQFFRTSDGGSTWKLLAANVFDGKLKSTAFSNSLVGFLGTSTGKIYSTTDGGETWFDEYAPTEGEAVLAISIVEGKVLYAVGANGMILKKSLSPYPGSQASSEPLHVYPNPASSHIYIDNVESGNTIIITDILGKDVHSYVVSRVPSLLDLRLLAKGAYRIMAANAHSTKSSLFVKD